MKKKIADIQILRALAIIFVLFHHFSLTFTLADKFPVKFNSPFYMGVEIFFVISGYVVSKSLLTKEINPLIFLIKRLFRLYPVLIVFITIGILINYCFHSLNLSQSEPASELFVLPWKDFINLSLSTLSGTFININKLPNAKYLFGAVWSLSVEFQFYTFITFVSSILVYLFRRNKEQVEIFFLITFSSLYVISNLIRIMSIFNQINIPFFKYIINWEFDFLFIGFVLSILERRLRWPLGKLISLSRETALFISPLLITIPLGLAGISESKLSVNQVIRQGFTLPIASICFTILVFISATIGSFPSDKGKLYSFLYWVGDRSYSIYLFNFPVMAFSWIVIYKYCPFLFGNGIIYGICQALITVVLLVPLVEIIYLKIETPCIEYCQKIFFKHVN